MELEDISGNGRTFWEQYVVVTLVGGRKLTMPTTDCRLRDMVDTKLHVLAVEFNIALYPNDIDFEREWYVSNFLVLFCY